MHNLSTQIRAMGLTKSAFAAKVGISPAHLTYLIQGKRGPSLDLAFRIERETRGKVKASSWVDKATAPRLDRVS